MNKFQSRFVALLVAVTATTVNALTINSPGVVGIWNFKDNANVATEIVAAQHLLDMAASSFEGALQADGFHTFDTSSTEYSGTLVGGLQTNTSVSGYQYGFAKYDGQSAGYVLFFLNGALASTIIPQFPATLWTTGAEQYALSHVTVFNAGGGMPGVPDGGSTLALLGLGLAALGVARRYIA